MQFGLFTNEKELHKQPINHMKLEEQWPSKLGKGTSQKQTLETRSSGERITHATVYNYSLLNITDAHNYTCLSCIVQLSSRVPAARGKTEVNLNFKVFK